MKIRGESTCRAFTTGAAFSLLGAGESQKKVPGTQGTYVLTSLSHSIRQYPPYTTGQDVSQPFVFAEKFKPNGLTVVPKTTHLRMARSQSGWKLIRNMLTGAEELYNLNGQPPGNDGPPQLPQGPEYDALRAYLDTHPNPF